jgi:histidinol-phosphatase (PHP family)
VTDRSTSGGSTTERAASDEPDGSARVGQATDLPLDAHLHTTRSPDANVPLEAYARAAHERRIAELAITDHVDFDPRRPAYAFSTFAEREREVRDMAERWADRGVAIRFGVEITYQREYEDDIRTYLRRHPYDFVIGSVHIGPDDPYTAERVGSFVAGRSLRDIVAPYFDEVLATARCGLFDTLGHLDFVKRYLYPHVTPADLAAAPELYEPLLRALVESGTALEVNASGLRQVANETYPSAATVARFRELGGRHVTAGSDAHLESSFAFGLREAYGHARQAGFRELAFRRGGERVAVALPGTESPNATVGPSL